MSFFMGGSLGGKNKVCWVSWDVVCKSKENGGLGVKNLDCFNIALLGKWVWRFLVGVESLWLRVLVSKYGDFVEAVENCRLGKTWDKSWSSWWRDLVKLVGCRDWFWLGLRRVVGDGKSTVFWEDRWIGGELRLRDIFPRLYSLETDKRCLVENRVCRVNGAVSGEWSWRRDLFVWEEEQISELLNLLSRYEFNGTQADKWS